MAEQHASIDQIPADQPVIDLSDTTPIDDGRHPYSAAEQILDLAA